MLQRFTSSIPYKKWKNAILKPFYFEKSVKMPIGERLFEHFREILLGKIVSNRMKKLGQRFHIPISIFNFENKFTFN
jgi:hypothetical protein